METMKLSEWLRCYHLSVGHFAKLVGVSRDEIRRYEKCDSLLDRDVVADIEYGLFILWEYDLVYRGWGGRGEYDKRFLELFSR